MGETTISTKVCPGGCDNTGKIFNSQQEVWMVSIRQDCDKKSLGQTDAKITNIIQVLKSKSDNKIFVSGTRVLQKDFHHEYIRTGIPDQVRRRLSPGEKYLHRLRQATPYRDSPVLTRMLKEI